MYGACCIPKGMFVGFENVKICQVNVMFHMVFEPMGVIPPSALHGTPEY